MHYNYKYFSQYLKYIYLQKNGYNLEGKWLSCGLYI